MTNAPTDLAGEKLSTAKAIADLIAVVNAHEATDSLYRHTLTTAALHIGELTDEARSLMD